MTRLVLANAIYFNALWETPFPENATRKDKFWTSPDKSVDVKLMRLRHDFRYFEDETVQVVALPYQGNEFSMIVVSPRKKDGLADVEKELHYLQFQKWTSSMRTQKIILDLPKFELEFMTQLEQTLSSMGMPLAFTEMADFSAIAEDRLFISAVIHKAYIDVHEKGTEAAAATAVLFELTSAIRPTMMSVNHPFLFCIRHNPTGTILFLGRMLKPEKG